MQVASMFPADSPPVVALEAHPAAALVPIEGVEGVKAVALLAEALLSVGHIEDRRALVLIAQAVALTELPLELQASIASWDFAPHPPCRGGGDHNFQ